MNMQGMGRGNALLENGARFGNPPSLASRFFAGGFSRLLDRIDRGLKTGSVLATFPDGSTRLIGGRSPGFEAEVNLREWRALLRLATNGSVGWYQGWEAGEWDSPDLVALFALAMANADTLGNVARAKGPWRLAARFAHWLNRNNREGAQRNIRAHYDLGNDFYAAWLDPTMSYSSALLEGASSLEQGQKRKWDRMAERLGSPGTVLEIGCGWGGFAAHLAERKFQVTAISLSESQLEWARRRHGAAVDFRKQDYRQASGRFDAIASIEMVEAIGREYWPAFFDCIDRCLKPGGRAAIQFIAIRDSLFHSYARNADFIQAYIFPGGMLVNESEFRRLAAERGLVWENQREFSDDYADTLKAWRSNFEEAIEQDRLPAGFDERFVRLWRYYLMYCEGGFRGGGISVSQVTLIKPGDAIQAAP